MAAPNGSMPTEGQPDMPPPQHAVYSSLDELVSQSNGHALAHGYKLVVVRSKTNAAGMKTWVQLACDRHGTKRNTHNLTTETRKKNRKSRRCECPMYCVASKQGQGLWELTVRNGAHNHEPYEQTAPKKKKSDHPRRHSSDMINLPLLQTPSHCIADFCLVPIGTGSASVSGEIAEVQRLLKRSGLQYSMSPSGTVVEGSWDEVTKIIGQAHSYLHGSNVVRINTDIRIGTRTDKKQTAQDKVNAVNTILDREQGSQAQSQQQAQQQSTPQQQPQHHAPQQQLPPQHHDQEVMAAPNIGHHQSHHQPPPQPRPMRQSMPTNMDSVIAPDLQSHVMGPPPPHMQMPPFHHHAMAPMDAPRLPSSTLPTYGNIHGR